MRHRPGAGAQLAAAETRDSRRQTCRLAAANVATRGQGRGRRRRGRRSVAEATVGPSRSTRSASVSAWRTRSSRARSAGGGPVHPACQCDDVRRAAPQQRHRAPGVAPLQVRQPDRELRQPPPQLPLRGLGGLPRRLQHLVGVERHPLVEQPLGLVDALLRAEHQVVRHPLDPDRATRQRAAGGVAGARVAGTARGVAVALVGHAVHRATATPGAPPGPGGCEAGAIERGTRPGDDGAAALEGGRPPARRSAIRPARRPPGPR